LPRSRPLAWIMYLFFGNPFGIGSKRRSRSWPKSSLSTFARVDGQVARGPRLDGLLGDSLLVLSPAPGTNAWHLDQTGIATSRRCPTPCALFGPDWSLQWSQVRRDPHRCAQGDISSESGHASRSTPGPVKRKLQAYSGPSRALTGKRPRRRMFPGPSAFSRAPGPPGTGRRTLREIEQSHIVRYGQATRVKSLPARCAESGPASHWKGHAMRSLPWCWSCLSLLRVAILH